MDTDPTSPHGTVRPVRFPDASVTLGDGNAFAIMGVCDRALRKAGATQDDRDEFRAEMTSGDYDHLLVTVFRWIGDVS